MIALVVFDLDGTLVDSQQDLANSANALVKELGGRQLRDADVTAMVGEGAAVLVRRVLDAAGLDPAIPEALPRFLELYDARLIEHTVAYPGIPEILKELRLQAPLAVLTNKPQRVTDTLLGALDLARYFVHVIGGDTPLGRKPDPAGLLKLCAVAHARPADAVLVGDSPIDLETARRAGTRLILAGYGFGYRMTGSPEYPIAETPAEILRLSRELAAGSR